MPAWNWTISPRSDRTTREPGCGPVRLQQIPAVRLDDRPDDLATTLRRNDAAFLRKLLARDGEDAVAFAKRGTIESVGVIEPHFVRLRRTAGALRRAIQDLDKVPALRTGGMRNDDHGMRSPAEIA